MVESDSSVDSTAPSDSEAGGGGVEAGEGRGERYILPRSYSLIRRRDEVKLLNGFRKCCSNLSKGIRCLSHVLFVTFRRAECRGPEYEGTNDIRPRIDCCLLSSSVVSSD